MPTGASARREREYEGLKKRFKAERRYPGREEEVAARIVNKQRRQYGETAGEKEQAQQGRSPDRSLPIPDYERLTIPQVVARLDGLPHEAIRKILRYETQHKSRKGLLQRLERRLAAA